MRKFFNPASIAVVGASQRKTGFQIIQNLLYGYRGKIYPVNPNYQEVENLPCFPSVEDLPEPAELAIILVPAPAVPSVLEACVRKGIFRAMIESAGFAEVGEAGKAIQDRCKEIARREGIRVWGPNCMGLVDVPGKHFFTFMRPRVYEDGLVPGRISLIVQSGMLAGAFLTELGRRTIGIGKVCSIGNKVDVDECDLLAYLLEDPETDAVALYLESVPRGRIFAEMAKFSEKPIVVLKGGRSEAGAKAALSHTSSLAGNSRLLDGVLQMAGVTMADDFQVLLDLTGGLAMLRTIPPPGRTAILTFSGGAGILSCDLLEKYGLPIARLSEKTKESLGRIFPDWMPVANPVDLFPAMEMHGWAKTCDQAAAIAVEDPAVDALLIHFPVGVTDDFPDLAALKMKLEKAGKAAVFWLVGRQQATRLFRLEALSHGIPVYDEISKAVASLAAAVGFRSRSGQPEFSGPQSSERFKSGLPELAPEPLGESIWDEYDSKTLLARWHIPVVEERIVATLAEAKQAAREMGFPLVLKGLLPGEIHKTERGLVYLGVTTLAGLQDTFRKITGKMEGRGRILLQRQVQIDYELIAGFLRDDQFGACVMFGLGGIFSELHSDVVFALAPLARAEARELMEHIQGRKLLQGFRGMAPLDKERMADLLVNLGNLGAVYPQIEQIDINPVAVTGGIPFAVDANVILQTPNAKQK
jgi:acyl-CoA synthetase (NDP forming)